VQFFPNDKAIKLAYSKQDIEGTVRIAGASLTALLVSYCIRCKIPLPRISDKRIRVEEDCLVLEIRTTFNKAPAPEYAENAMRAAQAGKPAKWLASRKRAS
jgi:hypothetical protein